LLPRPVSAKPGASSNSPPLNFATSIRAYGYIDGLWIVNEKNGPLFGTIDRKMKEIGDSPLAQPDAWRMVNRRTASAGISTAVCNYAFRVASITTYLKNGGVLERARDIANHASTRTTQLYDRRNDRATL
jgi:hypothetical protein